MENAVFAPLEVKFAEGAPAGQFSGYAAVYGNRDAHGDLIVPDAFKESLAEHKAQNRPIPMHVMHRGVFGGDGLPVGVWNTIEEDSKGLRVEGKISGAANTDAGRLLFERVKDGALGGLSIGYRIKPNGVTYGKSQGDPKRTLKNLNLSEISLVDDPSDAFARVEEVKSKLDADDLTRAAKSVADAIGFYNCLEGGLDEEQTKAFLMSLQDAHEVLTGSRQPEGMKSRPTTVRGFEKAIREMGYSHSEARAIAEHGFKSSAPRDEADGQANVAVKTALGDLSAALSGFSLPKF